MNSVHDYPELYEADPIICPDCGGRGTDSNDNRCATCQGSGSIDATAYDSAFGLKTHRAHHSFLQ